MKVKVNNLSYAYSQKPVLHNLSFELESGKFLSIIGKNGTGKSTFVKCLLKIIKAPNDTILLDDVSIENIKRLSNIGYVPQKQDFNFEFPISVREILSCSYDKNRDSYYDYIIASLDLHAIYKQNINTLSGGQLQRVFIARALLTKPKLLVLDEPTIGVDSYNIEAIRKILTNLKLQNITMISITHDIEFCNDITDYYLSLDEAGGFKFYKAGE